MKLLECAAIAVKPRPGNGHDVIKSHNNHSSNEKFGLVIVEYVVVSLLTRVRRLLYVRFRGR